MIIKMLNGMLMKGLRRNHAGLNAVRTGVMAMKTNAGIKK